MPTEQQRAIELSPEQVAKYDMKLCRKTGLAKAIQMDAPFQVMTIQGNLAGGQPGDYLMANPDNPKDIYPCERTIFESTYEWVEPELPAKKTTTRKASGSS